MKHFLTTCVAVKSYQSKPLWNTYTKRPRLGYGTM